MVEQELALPAELTAPGLARGLVADLLAVLPGQQDFEHECTLLVSEVVTNAVLHGGGQIWLRCRAADGWVRVEVRDGSPIAPAVRDYSDAALTGRGVELVDALAACWGVAPDLDGKVVWFELGARPGAQTAAAPSEPSAPLDDSVVVTLIDAPLALLRAAIEHGDAVLREVAYLALAGRLAPRLPTGWRPPELDMSPILASVAEAPHGGRHDLTFTVDLRSGGAARDRLALVELADAVAAEGLLLTRPSVPEVARCRSWFLTEIAGQVAGQPPTPWAAPRPLPTGREPARLDHDVVLRLDAEHDATVVADDTNSIIYANGAAHTLLGWAPTTLVGQRLTVIIPPELRDAHLAGFTRLQLGGPPQILDRPTDVSALCHDGSTVEVRLTITALQADHARAAYRASLVPLGALGA